MVKKESPLLKGYCIDCHTKLTDKNRSERQPLIRCTVCFLIFSDKVRKTLIDGI